MRRKDREMGEDFALEVIDKSQYGVLGLVCEDKVYTLPLSIIRQNKTLYFHSAKEGRKVDMIKDNKLVSVTFVADIKVPKLFTKEEIIEKIEDGTYQQIGSKIFTTEFASAHVSGRIFEVKDDNEKIEVLKLISDKYTPEFSNIAISFIKSSLERTRIYKIDMESITGKRKKFDKEGKELKFQRME